MELLPIGPVVIIDTPGLDDEGTLGEARVKKARQVLNTVDIAVLVTDATRELTSLEAELLDLFKTKKIPYVIAHNKIDISENLSRSETDNEIWVSAVSGANIERLKEKIGALQNNGGEERHIVSDLIKAGDTVLLVVPIDKAAPKGRLILPQQQTIRDILDCGAMALVCRDSELEAMLASLKEPPVLVITDSQVFAMVEKLTPPETRLTSFSVLMARHKGDIDSFRSGANALLTLPPTARVLIAEACSHIPQNEDIGRVKLPRLLRSKLGEELHVDVVGGNDFPVDLAGYDIVIHCGACMFNRRTVLSRVRQAKAQGVPITNYGIAIAALTGIIGKVVI
jgi:[FeFe] hydrogenase H-cluster maturation GTPase HydF